MINVSMLAYKLNIPNLPYSTGSIILVIIGEDISPMINTSQFPTEKDRNFPSKEFLFIPLNFKFKLLIIFKPTDSLEVDPLVHLLKLLLDFQLLLF